jgi:hypothetical protein
MIKIIEMNNKVNVVDGDNNFVGYDLNDSCCAKGGYLISETKHRAGFEELRGLAQKEFPDHKFDEDFFEEVNDAVIFLLRSDTAYGKKKVTPLYLHLFNVHNGYYGKTYKTTFGKMREGVV